MFLMERRKELYLLMINMPIMLIQFLVLLLNLPFHHSSPSDKGMVEQERSAEIICPEKDPSDGSISGTFRGVVSGYTFTFVFMPKILNWDGSSSSEYAIKYRKEVFNYVAKKTSYGRFEVRVLRPSNTTVLGEYLSWEALVEQVNSETLQLRVVESLSSVEKLKYKLPSKGTVIDLKLGRGDGISGYNYETEYGNF